MVGKAIRIDRDRQSLLISALWPEHEIGARVYLDIVHFSQQDLGLDEPRSLS